MNVEFCTRSAPSSAPVPKFKHKSGNIRLQNHFSTTSKELETSLHRTLNSFVQVPRNLFKTRIERMSSCCGKSGAAGGEKSAPACKCTADCQCCSACKSGSGKDGCTCGKDCKCCSTCPGSKCGADCTCDPCKCCKGDKAAGSGCCSAGSPADGK